MTQQEQTGMPSLGASNNSTVIMPMSQQTASSVQSPRSEYVRVWEGNLYGLRHGQPVLITRLEGFKKSSAIETLAANWPSTMHIDRLITLDHMLDVEKADVIVFQALNHHGFLRQLQEKKLFAVIQLPSQTLFLYVTSKAARLIGVLFPGDMSLYKSRVPTRQQQQQHPQVQQQQLIYGTTQQAQISSTCVNNNSTVNMPFSHLTSSTSKKEYVKVWEGYLSALRRGQSVLITKLEGYWRFSASEMPAANWPSTMQIARLISQDHLNNKQYAEKAEFFVFRAANQPVIFRQLQEKELCPVIELPSQTLVLHVSDKFRLFGMLLPGDLAAYQPQVSTQQQQVSSRESTNMAGGNFMNK